MTEGSEPGLLEGRVDDAAVDLRGSEPGMGNAAEPDIVGHRESEVRHIVLNHHRDASCPLGKGQAPEVRPTDPHRTGRWGDTARQ